jgi:hypothetical protein
LNRLRIPHVAKFSGVHLAQARSRSYRTIGYHAEVYEKTVALLQYSG